MKVLNLLTTMTFFAFSAVGSSGVFAQANRNSGNSGEMTREQPAAATEMTDGVVRKVDQDAMKITIKHGAIKNLDMPPMTMVYRVKDPAMLDKVQKGDRVRFKAAMDGSAMVVTEIQSAE